MTTHLLLFAWYQSYRKYKRYLDGQKNSQRCLTFKFTICEFVVGCDKWNQAGSSTYYLCFVGHQYSLAKSLLALLALCVDYLVSIRALIGNSWSGDGTGQIQIQQRNNVLCQVWDTPPLKMVMIYFTYDVVPRILNST